MSMKLQSHFIERLLFLFIPNHHFDNLLKSFLFPPNLIFLLHFLLWNTTTYGNGPYVAEGSSTSVEIQLWFYINEELDLSSGKASLHSINRPILLFNIAPFLPSNYPHASWSLYDKVKYGPRTPICFDWFHYD